MPQYRTIYPDTSEIDVVLRAGQSLKVRPITTADKKKLEELFYRLSPWTRYLRFGYTKSYISETELAYYTEIQPPQRYAYVATMGQGEEERIVAVARWFLAPDGKSAEVAFVVEDNIQVRGIGTALLEQLASAAIKFNIKRFVARVLPENTRMLEVFDESGFKLVKELEEGAYEITIDLEEQEEFSKRQAYREHIARSAGVRRILYPKSVAVVGASRSAESVGGAIFRNLLQGGFTGTIFPVNPNTPSVGGVLSYPSVLDIPGDVDIAVIAIPAERVLDVVDQCGKKGVWGLVIISAGFGEAGPAGKERERQLREKVLSYGMRVIGPNCLGIFNGDPDVQLDATFSPVIPPSGNLSIGSQSGALGLALLDYAKSMSLGIGDFVSIGNRVDISSNDLLEFWEDDEKTHLIVLYLESFGNPRKFSRIARRVSHIKPIIAVKAGKSEVGARAATSHTGALAAAEVAVDAMFREAGVIRVTTIEEMFNVAKYLSNQPLPKGRRVGILTNAGGPGVLAADACEGMGLKVQPLSGETRKKLREFLPAEAAVTNPVDMIASAPAEYYDRALSLMLEDPDIDAVIVIYIPPLVTRPEDVAAAIRKVMGRYTGEKPVLACFMTSRMPELDLHINQKKYIPSFSFPEDAVQALAHGYNYARYRAREEGHIPKFPGIDRDRVRGEIFRKERPVPEGKWLYPEVCAELLGAYGIPVALTRPAFSAEEAVRQAGGIGFPVAMKLRSSAVVHKTDVGGVELNLENEEEVRQAYGNMAARLEKAGMLDKMEGVVLQKMIFGGQEVIVGMTQDPLFGPLIMVGLGGVQVELMKDVSFSLHPLTDRDPGRMLKRLKSLPMLTGWRGRSPKDVKTLEELLLRFSALVEDFPEIEEMEINPLLVFGEGKGALAIDARVYMKG